MDRRLLRYPSGIHRGAGGTLTLILLPLESILRFLHIPALAPESR
jgi:hypothetical protein